MADVVLLYPGLVWHLSKSSKTEFTETSLMSGVGV